MKTIAVTVLAIIATLSGTNGFVVGPSGSGVSSPDVSNTALFTALSYGGKKKDFRPGSPLKNACASLGVKPKYNCRKGDCGSCTISVGGTRMKACIGKVPPEPKLKSLIEKGLEIKG